jgi:hypothetical protein
MKCKKCNADINLPENLEGKKDENDISHFQCDKCKEYFCKEHLKPVFLKQGEDTVVVIDKKAEYINLCDDCHTQQSNKQI